MCCRSSPEVLDAETITSLQDWLIESVNNAQLRRGTIDESSQAFREVIVGTSGAEAARLARISDATFGMRDDALRIVIELFHTAAVMHALGEFPTPDEGRTD